MTTPFRTAGPDPRPEDSRPPDAAAAQRLLREAEQRSRTVPSASLPAAFITYGILCTLGTFGVLCLHLTSRLPEVEGFSPLPLVIVSLMAWVGAAMVPLLLTRDRWRRGLGRQWVTLIVLWAVLWAAGMFLAASLAATMILAPLFLVLFVVAIATEIRTRQRADRQAEARTGTAL